MARAVLWNVVLDQEGEPVAGASVYVYLPGTTTPLTVPMYGSSISPTELLNPLTTDANGRYEAWINGGGRMVTTVATGGGIVTPQTRTEAFVRDTFGDPVPVTSYGAVADGTTDCTAAINAAFAAGGTVTFPLAANEVGYRITTPLFIGDGTAIKQSDVQSLRVFGTGSRVATAPSPLASKIEFTLEGYVPIIWAGASNERMLEVRGPIQNVWIEGLGFDCLGVASSGIRTYDLQNSVIRNCKVINHVNCVDATGDERTLRAAFDFRAYSVGDATPNSLLSSNNGGNGCLFENLYTWSGGARPAGFAVGQSAPGTPDGTGLWTVAGGSPDVSQCKFVNCINMSANQAGSVGLALRYTDGITFDQCSFPALIPISVEVPIGADGSNGLRLFPNYIVMSNVHVDNGRSTPNGGWNDCRIIGTWEAEHRIIFSPVVNALDSDYAPAADFGWGWTTHDKIANRSGLIGNWRVGGSMDVDSTLLVGAAAQFNSSVTATGAILANGGEIRFPATQIPSAGANVLDDYEEGTWTPSLGGTEVFSSRTGTYVKVGRMVHVFCRFAITTIGTGATFAVVGLPFAASGRACGHVSGILSAATNFVFLTVDIANGSTTASLDGIAAAGTATAPIAVLGNSTALTFQATYLTAN
jgi:hypothetical protein